MRKDIQALRALAVFLVVFFHAKFPFMENGFLGVDIFFVISGYLIIGLLLRELELKNRINLLAFFARRVRRLLPAASLVLLTTVFLVSIITPGIQGQESLVDVVSGAFLSANLRFGFKSIDYWSTDFVSPVIHYWSLGVEEQFYVLFPVLLTLSALIVKNKKSRISVLIGLLSLISFLSFFYMFSEQSVESTWAFYSPIARAWEFAIGGIAVVAHRWNWVPKYSTRVAIISTSYILIGFTIFGTLSFKLSAIKLTIPTVLAVAALLYFGSPNDKEMKLFNKALDHTPFVWLGTISYSIYLWHWTVLSFGSHVLKPDYPGPSYVPFYQRALLILLTVLLAQLTYVFVENSVRNNPTLVASSGKTLLVGVGLSVGVATIALIALKFVPTRISDRPIADVSQSEIAKTYNSRAVADLIKKYSPKSIQSDSNHPTGAEITFATQDFPITKNDGCLRTDSEGELQVGCAYANLTSNKTVVLFGSSHANMFFAPILDSVAKAHAKLLVRTRSGCPVSELDYLDPKTGTFLSGCAKWRKAAVAELIRIKPQVIVISTGGGAVRDPLTNKLATPVREAQLMKRGLAALVNELDATGSKLVFIRETPRHQFDYPSCLSTHTVRACSQPLANSLMNPAYSFPTKEDPKIYRWDLSKAICNERICPAVRSNLIVWRDKHHITNTYAKALSPLFNALLIPLIN